MASAMILFLLINSKDEVRGTRGTQYSDLTCPGVKMR